MIKDAMAAALNEIIEGRQPGEMVLVYMDRVDHLLRHVAGEALREAAGDVDDGEFSSRESAAARAALLARADELDPA